MSLYAQDTSVSVERSRDEIEQLLKRYGADAFGYMTEAKGAAIHFKAGGLFLRFTLPMPTETDVAKGPSGRRHPPGSLKRLMEKEQRRRWRSLALLIKAKLDSVASKITVFQEEFMAHIILPGGKTVGETAIPLIADAYKTGKVSGFLLPGIGETGNGKGVRDADL